MTAGNGYSRQVREGCAAVAEQADWVQVRHDRLAAYAASLPLNGGSAPQLDPEAHYLGSPEATAAFILQLDTINFGSGYFPHLAKLPGRSGYFTVATHLANHFRQNGPFTPRELEDLSAADCAELFHQDLDNHPVTELMWLFATALQDLGHYVRQRFAGSYSRMVASACASSQRLVGILVGMRMFRDVARHKGVEVPFFKRAQLCAADLALALEGKPLGVFRDLDELTIFADNLVPHVLRVDGLLEYAPDLANRVDGGTLLAAGAPEEVEIRACAVHAVELLRAELARQGRPTTAMRLDYLLWNRGQQPAYKAIPRHRTRTVFY
ncbi:MAG: queuosine salvage family protein [Thermoanaerobaculaceae bacterium]